MPDSLFSDRSKNAAIKKDLLKLCIQQGHCSIARFSSATGCSVPTMTKIVSELINDGFLENKGKIDTVGGRRPVIYGLNPQAGYFIGIDIARQHFHMAVCDFMGTPVHFIQDIEFVLEPNADSFHRICKRIKEEVEVAKVPWEKVLGAGVSLSGRVNPERGYSLTYFLSDDIPIKGLFEKELGIPIGLENDSRAMTYGEYCQLGDQADKNMIFVNLSWGLGMGIIMNGQLYYGKSGFSGEIGHFPLLNNDILCRCGKIGCLETEASGSALYRMIIERLRQGGRSSLSYQYEKNHDLKLREILTAVEEEDVLAIDGVEKIGTTLGKGLAGVINVFNPGLVVIGGRLIVGKDYLMLPIKTAVNKYSLSKVSSDTRFMFSTLGDRAASIGDCLLSRTKVLGLM